MSPPLSGLAYNHLTSLLFLILLFLLLLFLFLLLILLLLYYRKYPSHLFMLQAVLLVVTAVKQTSSSLLTSGHLVSLLPVLQQNLTSPSHAVSEILPFCLCFVQQVCLLFLTGQTSFITDIKLFRATQFVTKRRHWRSGELFLCDCGFNSECGYLISIE